MSSKCGTLNVNFTEVVGGLLARQAFPLHELEQLIACERRLMSGVLQARQWVIGFTSDY